MNWLKNIIENLVMNFHFDFQKNNSPVVRNSTTIHNHYQINIITSRVELGEKIDFNGLLCDQKDEKGLK